MILNLIFNGYPALCGIKRFSHSIAFAPLNNIYVYFVSLYIYIIILYALYVYINILYVLHVYIPYKINAPLL